MKNIFKNKLLIILVLFSILVVTMCTSVFASFSYESYDENSDITYTFNNIDITFKDSEDSFFIWPRGNTEFYVCYYDSSLYHLVDVSNNGSGAFLCYVDTNTQVNPNKLRVVTLGCVRDGAVFTATDFIEESYGNYIDYGGFPPRYSSKDIVNSNGEVVFQGAPQAQVAQVELMKPTQVEEILPQIIAIVEIVLPIFLGIFGILLVLYLIKSKNLLHL